MSKDNQPRPADTVGSSAAPAKQGGQSDWDRCGRPKSDGGVCGQAAGTGTPHLGRGPCKFHGGCLPNVVKKWRRVDAIEAVVTFGLPREIDPHQALLEEIWRTAGHVSWLEARLQELDGADLIFGKTAEGFNADGAYEDSTAAAHMWYQLYEKERKHLVQVAKIAIAAGIAERQVRLAEDQGRLIAQVIRGALEDLGVNVGAAEASNAVRRHLALIQGGQS